MHRGYRVGLLDTDLQTGGLRTLFGLDEAATQDPQAYWWLSPSFETTKALKAELRRYTDPWESAAAGIYLPPLGSHLAIATDPLPGLLQHYQQDKPDEVLQALSADLALDFLLIDNQPEMTDENLIGLSLADIILVLMQLDTYDLQRTAVLLEVINQLAVNKTWLVPSLVLPTIETSVVTHMLENTYQYPVAGILYLTEEMVSLASQGVFCLHYPDHALTQTMMAIAHHIEQDAQAIAAASASST